MYTAHTSLAGKIFGNSANVIQEVYLDKLNITRDMPIVADPLIFECFLC